MKKLVLFILISNCIVASYKQRDNSGIKKTIDERDTISVEETIYNKVYKNVAAYYIKYSIMARSEIDKRGYLQYEGTDLFDQCLPDKGYTLDMDIKKLDWTYPAKGYTVYEIKLNGFRFTNTKLAIVRSHQIFDGPTTPPDHYYLLIVNNIYKSIKFISGNYFLNDISDDFKFDKSRPYSYIEYLKYKTYQYQTKNIEFIKRKGKNLYYSAYAAELESKINIEINSDKPATLKMVKEKD